MKCCFLTEFSKPDSYVASRLPSEVKNAISKITLNALTVHIVRENG